MRLEDITRRAIDEVSAELEEQEKAREQELASEANVSENLAEFAVGDSVIFTITSPARPASGANINFKAPADLKQPESTRKSAFLDVKDEEAALNLARKNLVQNSLNLPAKQPKVAEDTQGQIAFLQNLRERIEVLFVGLNETPKQNLEDRLELTLKFLEFTLANVENHLEKLSKS